MKRAFLAALVIGGTLWATVSQATLTLNFAGVNGSEIQFSGSTFNITGDPSAQFQIQSTVGGIGSADNLYGGFSGGPWTIGTISSTTIGAITTQNAAVTPTMGSTITINDGTALLTGSINWVEITTINNGGILNDSAVVNVTGLSYSGVNQDLVSLATLAGGDGSLNLSFSFTSGGMLTDLTDGGTYGTSYSGSIAAVPEPTTLIAGALLLLPFGVSTLWIVRKQSRVA